MTQRNDEDFLREAFQDLKRDTGRRGAVPDVQAMLARAREEAAQAAVPEPVVRTATRPSPWARRSGWLSLAAAATLATLFLMDGSSAADREFEQLVASYSANVASGALSSPTDALLRTPGLDLGTVPSFGSALRGLGARPDANDGRDS